MHVRLPHPHIFFLKFIGCCLWITGLIQSAAGQGFGKNKVLYDVFDFRVQKTAHFDIHHYLDSNTIHHVAYLSERWYQRYEEVFKDTFHRSLPVILYADHPDFQQTEVVSGLIDVGTGGVTEGLKNRLVMPLAGYYSGTDHVLGHEMAHMFQYHILRNSDSLRLESIYQVPLWMIEGMAEYLSVGPVHTLTSMWMRDAVLHNDVPTLRKISFDFRYNPYRYGHAVWSFIAGTWGDTIILPLFLNTAMLGFETGIRQTLGISADSLSKMWMSAVNEMYLPQLGGKEKPYAIGKTVLSANRQGGEYYLGPGLSPNGKYVVFYSERDLLNIDIFLADAKNGMIIRKLGSRESNAHYDELSFIASSGAWSPDGKYFAFPVYSEGTQKIAIADITTGKITRSLGFQSIGGILNIAWSPDGNSMMLTATGTNSPMADLYLLTLSNDSLIQITSDSYAELHAAYSQDGKLLAFVSDRGKEADTSGYAYGKMQLCLLSTEDYKITILRVFDEASHFNPQFSEDGKSVYFISDPDGINNIYRYELSNGEIFKITNAATGISGLTELSPAMTYAKDTALLLFTLYDDMQLKGNILTGEALKGSPAVRGKKPQLNQLPPEKSTGSIVADYIRSPGSTMVGRESIRFTRPYRSRLSLDYLGGIYTGAGFSQYGTALQGGVYLRFSDILNRHLLNTVIQANGRLSDIAGMVFYINQVNRFYWGGYVSHIPYLSSTVFPGLDTLGNNGSKIITPVINQLILRAFEERVTLFGSYPLSRINRIEVYAGETYVSYNRQLITYYPLDAPLRNLEKKQKLPAPEPIHYTNLTAAYVGDNSYFGLTDPMKGTRYRFETEGIINSYKFMNLLGDYRKYYFVRPFSFAFRLLHYGRYFKDAENKNLFPLFLGNEFFMHGYSIFSIASGECDGNGDCPVFDRLTGSKLAIFNTEFRIPFTGPERLAMIKSRTVFSTVNMFFDGGSAWAMNDLPVLTFATRSNQRIPVFSAGVSYRINLFGVMILEFYYAYPFQRPDKGWHFGFQIMPGW